MLPAQRPRGSCLRGPCAGLGLLSLGSSQDHDTLSCFRPPAVGGGRQAGPALRPADSGLELCTGLLPQARTAP